MLAVDDNDDEDNDSQTVPDNNRADYSCIQSQKRKRKHCLQPTYMPSKRRRTLQQQKQHIGPTWYFAVLSIYLQPESAHQIFAEIKSLVYVFRVS